MTSTNNAPLDAKRCPLCGGDNACGLAAGKTTCWCFEAKLDEKALDAVPVDSRGRVCICPGCGGVIAPDAPRPES